MTRRYAGIHNATVDEALLRYEILDVDDSVVASADSLVAARYACATLLTSDEDRDAGYRTLQIFDLQLGRAVEIARLLDGPPGFYIEPARDSALV